MVNEMPVLSVTFVSRTAYTVQIWGCRLISNAVMMTGWTVEPVAAPVHKLIRYDHSIQGQPDRTAEVESFIWLQEVP